MDFDNFNFNNKKGEDSDSESTNATNNLEKSYIDIYIQQRNARKRIITIQGLENDKDLLKKYSKDLRKILNCSCSVDKTDDGDYFLKLSSKDITLIQKYLIESLNIDKELIRIHGQ